MVYNIHNGMYIAKIGTTDSELLSGNMRGEREENSLKKRAQVYIEMDGEYGISNIRKIKFD